MKRVLLALILLALCGVDARAVTPPTAPTTFTVPYSLPTGGTTYVLSEGADNATTLQAAINAAALGDVIILTADHTYTGNFTLPDKGSGTDWIYIISSELASLPEGQRVGPADAIHMPKIVDSSGGRPLVALFGAHNYRFAGIEISTANTSTTMVMFGSDNAGHYAHTIADLPHDITFDRCYLHSTSESNAARVGILLDGRYMAVIDSYISNFKDSADAQAILVWNGSGPFKIVNNYLESTGENFMSGGTDPQITHDTDPTNYPDVDTGAVPSDIEFRGNFCYKPNKWNQNATIALGWPTDEYAGIDWSEKNIFEIKNVQRILISGNIFDNMWPDAQSGRAIVIKASNAGAAPWCRCWDVAFRCNKIAHTSGAIDLVASQNPVAGTTCAGMKRVLIEDNLADLISAESWTGTLTALAMDSGSVDAYDISVNHNTFILKDTSLKFISLATVPWHDVSVINNIARRASYGVKGVGGEGTTSLTNGYVSYSYTKNLLVDLPGPGTQYPADNFNADGTVITTVGFTNYASGDFSLTAESTYHHAGTDGKDLGPDWPALSAATANAKTGRSSGASAGNHGHLMLGNRKTKSFYDFKKRSIAWTLAN